MSSAETRRLLNDDALHLSHQHGCLLPKQGASKMMTPHTSPPAPIFSAVTRCLLNDNAQYISPPLHQYLLLKQGTSCMITPHISPPQHQYLPCLSLSESIRTYQRNSDTLRLIPIGSDKLRYPPNNIPPAPYRTICSLERTSVHASAHLCPQTHARAAPRLRTCLRTPPHQHAHRSSLPFQLQRTYALTPLHFRSSFSALTP